MSRDGRIRDKTGGSLIASTRLADFKGTEGAINKLIEHVNKLKKSVNSESNQGPSSPNEGRDGDIRLFSDTAADGTKGYFIEGKFGNNWAVQRLSLVVNNEDAGDNSSASGSFGDEGFNLDLTSSMVTFENLNLNGDVGEVSGTVSQGNHSHDHDALTQNHGGTGHHALIQEHMDNDPLHRLANEDTTTIRSVKSAASAANPGTATTWAPSDHEHILDETISYAFTNQISVSYSQENVAAITVSNTDAAQPAIKATGGINILSGDLSVDGDASITGDLTVGFAEAAGGDAAISGNTTIAGYLVTTGDISGDEDLSIDKNVFLNGPLTAGAETNDFSTTIFGKTYTKNVVEILHQVSGGEKHLTMKHDGSNWGGIEVDNNGTMLIHATGNIELHSDTDGSSDTTPGYSSILPGDAGKVNIGSQLKRFKTLFVDELYAETFVAQEVLATSGGRIIVAPTTKLKADLGDDVSDTTITVEHNNLANGDFAIMRSSSVATGDGLPVQMEVLEITSSASANGDYWDYTVTRDVDATGRNTWIEGSAVVNFGHEMGDGYIEITSTRTLTQNLGPSISMFARISGSEWDDASLVAHVGDLNGFAGISSTKFGAAFGKNLLAAQNAVSDPFTGMLVDGDSGLQIYNTNIEIYDGSSRNAILGKDAAGKTVFVVGGGISESGTQGVWNNAKLTFAEDVSGTYVLTIDGAVNLTGDTTTWPFLETEADVVAAMGNMTSSATPSEGFYLAANYIGYYDGGGTQPWPIQIGNVDSEQYAYIGNTDRSNYLEYNSVSGLTVKGTIISEATTFAYGSIAILGTLDGSTKVINISDWGGLSFGYRKATASFYAPLSATKARVTIRYKDVENSNCHVMLNNVLMTSNGLGAGSNNAVQDVTYTIPEIDSSTETFLPLTGVQNYHSIYGTDTEILKIDSANELEFYSPSGETDKYEVHYVKVEYEIGSVTEHNTLVNLSNTITISNGSIAIGNTEGNAIYTEGKTSIDDTTSGFWMGMQEEDIPGFNIGDAGAFLKYKEFGLELQMGSGSTLFKFTNSEFSIKGANLEVTTGGTHFYAGKDIENVGPVDSVLVGSWNTQTIDSSGNTAPSGKGLLVNHSGTRDYTSLNTNGFVRRGYSYPIFIYEGFHWGGPLVWGYPTPEPWDDSQATDWGNGSTGIIVEPNVFYEPLSIGTYHGAADDTQYINHRTFGSMLTLFMDYDYTTVPSGRKLVWSAEPVYYYQGYHNQYNGINETINVNYANKIHFLASGNNSRSAPLTFIHNSQVSHDMGLTAHMNSYYGSYNSSNRHHFGFNPNGCRKNTCQKKWCYVQGKYLAHTGPLLEAGVMISYGEIPEGTNLDPLYFISMYHSYEFRDWPYSGIICNKVKIWETDMGDYDRSGGISLSS